MDVKEAVKSAKSYVSDLLVDEGVFDLALEEVEYVDGSDEWNVTIGFSRAKTTAGIFRGIEIMSGHPPDSDRLYRVVKIRDADGKVLSLKLREFQN